MSEKLKALGASAGTQYNYGEPDPSLLETFEAPDNEQHIKIVAPEFTSLCPKTGQPDFATIVIWYQPTSFGKTSVKPDPSLCVESKSLKLYLGSFRNHGEFHESCISRICNDLSELLDPEWIVVQGQFTPRGGIPFWPTSYREMWSTVPEYIWGQLG